MVLGLILFLLGSLASSFVRVGWFILDYRASVLLPLVFSFSL